MRKGIKIGITMMATIILVFTLCSMGIAQKVTLRHWYMSWGSGYDPVIKEMAEDFGKAHPNIEVKVDVVPWSEYVPKFLTAVVGGAAPDTSEGSSFQPLKFAAMDEILPVDDIIEEWKAIGRLEDLYTENHRNYLWQDHYWALPVHIDPRGLLYREDLFAEAGLTKPTDWSGFLDAARKLTKGDMYGYVTEMSRGHGPQQEMLYLAVQNAAYTLNKEGRLVFDNPKMVEVFEFIKKLRETMPPGVLGYAGNEAEMSFIEGKVAIYKSPGCPSARLSKNHPEFARNVGVLDTLTGPAGIKAAAGWTNPIMIYRQTKHPIEAKMWVRWFIKNLDRLYTSGDFAYPCFKSLASLPFYTEDRIRKEMLQKAVPYARDYTYPYHGTPIIPIIEENYVWTDGVLSMFVENKSPQEAVEWIEQKIKELIGL